MKYFILILVLFMSVSPAIHAQETQSKYNHADVSVKNNGDEIILNGTINVQFEPAINIPPFILSNVVLNSKNKHRYENGNKKDQVLLTVEKRIDARTPIAPSQIFVESDSLVKKYHVDVAAYAAKYKVDDIGLIRFREYGNFIGVTAVQVLRSTKTTKTINFVLDYKPTKIEILYVDLVNPARVLEIIPAYDQVDIEN